CNREHRAVVPWGGGTLQHLGNLPTRYDAVIQTTNLNQVVDYAYDDLTATFQAGMTLAEIERVLAEHGQFLPIDVPHPEHATLGGVLATGVNGPLRLRYGPARDFMLGNRFAIVEGHVIKAGSKVVKNVAGYELHKVQAGAFGTLGIITEATFKLFPKPTAETSLWASFDQLNNARTAVPKIWNLSTPPLAIELLDANTARLILPNASGAWHLAVRFGGSKAAMAAARDLSAQVARENGARSADAVNDVSQLWHEIADLPKTLRESAPDTVMVQVSVPPKELANALRILFDTASTLNLAPPRMFSHAAVTDIYASFGGDMSAFEVLVKNLRAQLHDLHGHLAVTNAPTMLKNKIDAWDEPGASFQLMQSLKRKVDPNNILNPGRFVGGI